ncbi:type III pantothenate kinase [Desulfosarcina ovata]|uniref:Type III pantothenate kinase n=1 Tax=Desulfosarcina ovata subsp. ovata TaxID=2752305 RepID=A0A5K8AG97_9BACT|nr:type III pantothenate kinase [Desulfosarcina ovata]BBO91578.1 type III pantothenate kinase [Desulfosarcina ovata subsp. ovata]
MILCLNIGNTNMTGGVFDGPSLKLDFRRSSRPRISVDEFGLFLLGVLHSNAIDPSAIRQIAICSVLPEATYSLNSACRKYFSTDPFVIRSGVRTGLKIRYRNPREVGADRIANAMAAVHHHPQQDLVVASFGTATTFCAIGADKTYHGGVILPGIRISLAALVSHAAQLASVEIIPVDHVVGRSTAESMQSGLYYGQIGMAREIIDRMRTEAFQGRQPLVIGTGEFSGLFATPGLLDVVRPELALEGLYLALMMNA